MSVVIQHGSMFEAVLLQCVLHAAVALLHGLGEVTLSCGVVLLHGLHSLQLGMEATHICSAHIRCTQQLQSIRHYMQCLVQHNCYDY